jgi:SAM-dependent methyltransferase
MAEADFLTSTRASYDAVATEYAEFARNELQAMPLERAMLAAFAERVTAHGAGPVADLGCGPGQTAAYLHSLGVEAFGLDLSPGMVAVARQQHPGLRFEVGSMTVLDLPDASLGGLVSFYSTIHLPPEQLPEVFAGFHRVLAPGGHALLVFQAGQDGLHLAEAFDKPIDLTYYWRDPDRVAALLSGAGFTPVGSLRVEPDATVHRPRACLLVRKAAEEGSPHEG